MDVYIDLVYIVNALMGTFCILSLSLLTGKIMSVKKVFGLSLFWGFHILTLYLDEWLYYIWVIILCVFIDKHHLIRNFFLFLFLHETYLNSLSGVYRIGQILVISTDFDWLLPLLCSFLIIFIYTCFWFQLRKETQQQSLYYQVIVNIDNQEYKGNAFMDTGNQALFEGIPIIFCKHSSFTNPQKIPLQFIVTHKKMEGYLGEIFFNQQWQTCYVVIHENLEIEADFLLNYYLL